MKVFFNDEECIIDAASCEVSTFLESVGIRSADGIALAVNEEIVPKKAWRSFSLKEDDRILIITATQGG